MHMKMRGSDFGKTETKSDGMYSSDCMLAFYDSVLF